MSAPLCVRCTSHDRRACEGVRQFATITASCSCGCHFAPQVGGAVVPVSDAEADRDAQRTRAEAAEAEVARLRAIVEGRTTAPTDAEIAAHDAAGGTWLVRYRRDGWGGDDAALFLDVLAPRDVRGDGLAAVRWWPLDASGRPCAWPEVPR